MTAASVEGVAEAEEVVVAPVAVVEARADPEVREVGLVVMVDDRETGGMIASNV